MKIWQKLEVGKNKNKNETVSSVDNNNNKNNKTNYNMEMKFKNGKNDLSSYNHLTHLANNRSKTVFRSVFIANDNIKLSYATATPSVPSNNSYFPFPLQR